MKFSEIIGNQELARQIAQIIDEGRLGHAILLDEMPGGGALAFALAIAQYINCKNRSNLDSCGSCPSCLKIQKSIHPDIHFAFPVNTSSKVSKSDKNPVSDLFLPIWREMIAKSPYFTESQLYNEIGIDNKSGNISAYEAKQIINKLVLHPYEASHKVMIIWMAERMNLVAANKLLKLLEEPSPDTIFILISNNPDKLLPTIISRCRAIKIPPMDISQLAKILEDKTSSKDRAAICAKLSGGSYGKALQLIDYQEESAESEELIISIIEAGLRKNFEEMYPLWNKLADLKKEKQKEFCIKSEEVLRRLLMIKNGLNDIAFIEEESFERFTTLASKIKDDFFPKAVAALDKTLSAIESNVNSKLTFCDLCNRFLLYL